MLISAICPKIFKALSKVDKNVISNTFQIKGKNPIDIKIKYSFEYICFNVFVFIKHIISQKKSKPNI
jgi:hypothetical protein